LVAAALTACGGSSAVTKSKPTVRVKHRVQAYVDLYAGLPLKGPMAPEGRAILKGVTLALDNAHSHPGDLHIKFIELDDSGQKSGDANLALTAKHAGRVALDPRAVYYIGDVGSAEATITLPILDAAGIAQVTPGDPYVAKPGTQSGAAVPAPAQRLLRLLPDYTVQAATDMLVFKEILPHVNGSACTRVLALAQTDPESESTALVDQMDNVAKTDGIVMPKPIELAGKANSLTSQQATSLHELSTSAATAPCGFVIAGSDPKPAVKLTKMVHSMFPHAWIVGTSGLCSPNSTWTRGAIHGAQAVASSLLWCTSPLLPIDKYGGSDEFLQLYKTTYGVSDPSPYAFYGYEAANLGIEIIDDLGADGDNRVAVRSDLFDTNFRDSVNPYGFLAGNEDAATSSYGVYSVSPATGEPMLNSILRP
jgi:branched-chain amino acid transport system substrate-binding protein